MTRSRRVPLTVQARGHQTAWPSFVASPTNTGRGMAPPSSGNGLSAYGTSRKIKPRHLHIPVTSTAHSDSKPATHSSSIKASHLSEVDTKRTCTTDWFRDSQIITFFRGLGGNPLDLRPLDLACLVQLVLHLHSGPQLGTSAKRGTQTISHVRRNSCCAPHNAGKRHSANT